MKSLLLSLFLTSMALNAHSDAIKYRQPNGQILITNQAPGEGAKEINAQRSEYISQHQQQAAQQDIERQREFLRRREQEYRPVSTSSSSHSQGSKDVSGVHACLMKVSSIFGLTPSEEARRKVNCYSGMVGMNGDCQQSVAATARLSTNEEMAYKRQCPM